MTEKLLTGTLSLNTNKQNIDNGVLLSDKGDTLVRWRNKTHTKDIVTKLPDTRKCSVLLAVCFSMDGGEGSDIWAASWQNQQNDFAPSEDSDQPGYPPSLIRVFACAQWVAKDPSFLPADSEECEHLYGFMILFFFVPEDGCDLWLWNSLQIFSLYEPRHEETCLRSSRTGKTQTGLRSHRS